MPAFPHGKICGIHVRAPIGSQAGMVHRYVVLLGFFELHPPYNDDPQILLIKVSVVIWANGNYPLVPLTLDILSGGGPVRLVQGWRGL
jgi:hypothetical protein